MEYSTCALCLLQSLPLPHTGPHQPTPILYPPDTSALAYRPMTLAGRHSTTHPGPIYQLPSSTTGTSVSGTLPQLSHHYTHASPFPYVASTQTPQNTYHPSSAFQPRQALPYTPVLHPVPSYLSPRGIQQTVGYVSPVSTSLQGHQAYSQLQPTSERLPNPQAAFSPQDSFSPVSQQAQAPAEPHQQQQQPSQQQWNPPGYH